MNRIGCTFAMVVGRSLAPAAARMGTASGQGDLSSVRCPAAGWAVAIGFTLADPATRSRSCRRCIQTASTNRMFDHWPQEFDPPLWRDLGRRPVPVWVDVGLIVAAMENPGFTASKLPLRVSRGGLHLAGRVPGWLHAWVRTDRGAWIGRVSCSVPTANGRGRLDIEQWCSSLALTPR